MNQEHKSKIEEIITDIKNNNGGFINADHLAAYFDQNHKERIIICGFMLNELNLLNRVGDHAYNLSKKGWEFNGFEYLEFESRKLNEKKDLEFRKSQIDLELAEKTLQEFPRTKWFARIGFVIAIVLALKELYIWLMQSQ